MLTVLYSFTATGHTQELKRHFSTLSLIGLASTTTISWTGLGLGLIAEIGAGGPGAVIYGFILVTILQCFLGRLWPSLCHPILPKVACTTGLRLLLRNAPLVYSAFSQDGSACLAVRNSHHLIIARVINRIRDLYDCVHQPHLCPDRHGPYCALRRF